MCGTELTGKFVEGFTPDELAWRHRQLAILCIKLGDCRTESSRVTLTEDLLPTAPAGFALRETLLLQPSSLCRLTV